MVEKTIPLTHIFSIANSGCMMQIILKFDMGDGGLKFVPRGHGDIEGKQTKEVELLHSELLSLGLHLCT